MKKFTFIPTLLVAFSALCFLSCETELEPPDPSIVNPEPIETECIQPGAFQASNFINGTDVNLNWVAGDEESSWQVQYGLSGFVLGSGTVVTASSNHYTITGLTSTNSYQFYVRSSCGGGEVSDWTGPISVGGTIAACAAPTNVAATRATDVTKINVAWSAATGQNSWQVQYGTAGFALGTGTIVTSTTPTKQLTGLAGTQGYQVYVRTACSASEFSAWVGPVNVASVGPVSFGYMNANVNGTQYNGLKPFFYPFTGATAHIDALDGKIIIQGHSDPLSNPSNNFTEITIRIPSEFWHTGTYTLNPTGVEMPAVTVDLIMVNPTNGWTTYESEIPGTITITNFDIVNLRMQGTFSFTYELTGDSSGGPFNVSSGTFDFPMEAEDWD